MTNHIIEKIKNKISECIQHMRITSCTEDNQRSITGFAGLKNLGNFGLTKSGQNLTKNVTKNTNLYLTKNPDKFGKNEDQ